MQIIFDKRCTNRSEDDFKLVLYFQGSTFYQDITLSPCILRGGIICGLVGRINGDSSN